MYDKCHVKVKVQIGQNGPDIERALKLFKKRVKLSNILLEVKDKQEYNKKSAIKRKAKQQAQRRNKMRILEEKLLDY